LPKINEKVIIAALIILSVAFLLPLLSPLNRIVVEESYLQFCSFLDLNIFHLVRDRSLPLWAFHFGGGYPFIKHPDNISLSPLFYMLALPLGSGIGVKLFIAISYMTGAAGLYLFAKRILRYDRTASAIASMLFIFNAFIPFQINTGNVKDVGWFYLPLALFTLFRSREDKRYIFYTACLVTLLILNGFSLYLVSFMLFVFIIASLSDVRAPGEKEGGGKILTHALLPALALSFLLGSVKILPILDLLTENIRAIDSYEKAAGLAMTFPKMLLAFFSRGPYALGNEPVMGRHGLGMGSVMYIGMIPAGFLVVSSVFAFRKVWRYLVAAGIFLFLSMADNSPVDLFRLLWHLPFFHSMHEVARYFSFPVVFSIPVISCAIFSTARFAKSKKWIRYTVYAVALAGAANMFAANIQYHRFTSTYQKRIPPMETGGEFFSVGAVITALPSMESFDKEKRWEEKYLQELAAGIQYYLLRQNIGLVNWFGVLNLTERAEPRYKVALGYGDYWKDLRGDPTRENGVFPNRLYRKEAYFVKGEDNTAEGIEWRANKISVSIRQPRPGILIINQNYDKEWRSDRGDIYNANGLLGVKLTGPFEGEITLRYHPKSFYIGAVISLITLAACFPVFLSKKRVQDDRVL
jgi:hypothetical protein